MENIIKETTRLLLQGTLTKEIADKILLDLHIVSKRTFRKAKPNDIVVGNTVYLLGDGNEIHTQTIDKVLRPDDNYKAYVADDGCRYGLDGLYVC
jgi:hypothetical protein